MIRCIVAIDTKRGMANDKGIPWRLPTDLAHYRSKINDSNVLMGYGTYIADHPSPRKRNYVAIRNKVALDPGYEQVTDAKELLKNAKEDIWVIGGAGLIKETMDLIDELHITQLNQDFHCTKFLPEYKQDFSLVSETPPQTENGITFTFQVWKRK